MKDYPTRHLHKAVLLFNALIGAGVAVNFIDHGSHYHVIHNADDATFATARASIGVPSSIDEEIANTVIPDDPSELS